ncbi:MAG TPA: superoxide dismutase, partial [Deltaproteobacteria bacterium]|nr:superoxide dismutase [Deltaproteobacteria bacterium]
MIELPKLPYAENALEPTISARTLEFHHGKHHKAYVDTTNKLVSGTDLENAPLETIIQKAAADPTKTTLFNNSAQVWNHTFFWQCLKPGGGGAPTGNIASKIDSTWGSA